ncbi:uncharacterized protein LOC144920897 isoform X1 [Branchiostoma floridae x Branchiostoma belcheri]
MGNGMNKVLPGLYIGNFRDSKDREQLTTHGITHILAIHDNAKKLHEDMNYLCIPASDSPHQNLTQHFRKSIKFIHESRLGGGACLIHCLAGVSRSVTVAAAYVMTVTNLGWRDTLKAIRQARAVANPNFGFQRQLQEFDAMRLSELRKWLRQKYPHSPFSEDEEAVKELLDLSLIVKPPETSSAKDSPRPKHSPTLAKNAKAKDSPSQRQRSTGGAVDSPRQKRSATVSGGIGEQRSPLAKRTSVGSPARKQSPTPCTVKTATPAKDTTTFLSGKDETRALHTAVTRTGHGDSQRVKQNRQLKDVCTASSGTGHSRVPSDLGSPRKKRSATFSGSVGESRTLQNRRDIHTSKAKSSSGPKSNESPKRVHVKPGTSRTTDNIGAACSTQQRSSPKPKYDKAAESPEKRQCFIMRMITGSRKDSADSLEGDLLVEVEALTSQANPSCFQRFRTSLGCSAASAPEDTRDGAKPFEQTCENRTEERRRTDELQGEGVAEAELPRLPL